MVWKGLVAISLAVLMVISTAPAWAFMRVDPDVLEIEGEILGEAISEKEMDEQRGTYLGVHFSVLFEGFWDILGNYNAKLLTSGDTGANTGVNNTSTVAAGVNALSQNLPTNTGVKIQASVGGFGGSRGIFQVTQVPGSGNLVTNNMILNIQIIQVMGNTVHDNLRSFWK